MKKPDKHRIAQRLTRGARDRKGRARVVSAEPTKPWKRRVQIPYPAPSAAYLGFGAALAMDAAILHNEFDGLYRTLRLT